MSKARMDDVLDEHIKQQFKLLEHTDKLRVLDFAWALAITRRPSGISGEELLRFSGSIPEDELEKLRRATEEEREREMRGMRSDE